ncbi:hypothetical protein [Streptomyces sp. SGAir0957]
MDATTRTLGPSGIEVSALDERTRTFTGSDDSPAQGALAHGPLTPAEPAQVEHILRRA